MKTINLSVRSECFPIFVLPLSEVYIEINLLMTIFIPTSKGDTTLSKLHSDLAPVYEVKTGNTIFLVAGKNESFFQLVIRFGQMISPALLISAASLGLLIIM